jgi:hypothetical protein
MYLMHEAPCLVGGGEQRFLVDKHCIMLALCCYRHFVAMTVAEAPLFDGC